MGSKPRISEARRLRRKSPNRRLSKTQACHRGSTHNSGVASVSDKLEALRNLIPSQKDEMKTDRLFQETADYIVLLRTQVFVLQKLVDFYGAQPPQENRSEALQLTGSIHPSHSS